MLEQMAAYARKWTEIGLCTDPADRPRAEAGLRSAYILAGLQPPEKIVWCGSPLAGALAIPTHEDRGACVGEKMQANFAARLGLGVAEKVGARVWADVGASVAEKVRIGVWASVGDVIRDAVTDNIAEGLLENAWDAFYGQHAGAWLGFYEYFHDIYGLRAQTDRLAGLWEIAKSAGWVFAFENVAIVCERHSVVRMNAEGQLHRKNGAAIEYPDGWIVYAR